MRAPAFWSRPGLIPTLLQPLAWLYSEAGRHRWRKARPLSLSLPVVCIGNLVAGGAGKTPVVLKLIAELQALGYSPHVLLRGYGGSESGPLQVQPAVHQVEQVGDEALLLAAQAPTWISHDRAAGGQAIAESGADLILMDDGFQNPHLAKDLSFLVIDGASGFGNGRVLPAGPLRETPTDGLKRAQALIMMGKDQQGLLKDLPQSLPLFHATLEARRPRAAYARFQADAIQLAEQPRYLAFAGIGRPEKFFQSLADLNMAPVESIAFADHHPYTTAELQSLLQRADDLGARLITTEKDLLRLPRDWTSRLDVLPVEVRWQEPEEGPLGLVQSVLKKSNPVDHETQP
ncbi:tetraacyldisaccharide 4'-kinase [Rhodovibrionaceae bacterium A322]